MNHTSSETVGESRRIGPSSTTSRRSVLGSVAGLGLAGAAGGVRGVQTRESESWPQPGYDSANTGYAPGNTAPTGTIREEWRVEIGDGLGPLIVGSDTVFAGGIDTVYALSAKTGTEQWQFEVGGDDIQGIALGNETVYITDDASLDSDSSNGTLYAVSISDGTERWRFEADSVTYVSDGGTFNNLTDFVPPAVHDGKIYCVATSGSDGGFVYAIDSRDGSEQWSFSLPNEVLATPAVANETVYIGCNNTTLYAIDALAGTERWQFETIDIIDEPPVVADGTVYVESGGDRRQRGGQPVGGTTNRGVLYAIDSESGTEQWSIEKTGRQRGEFGKPTVSDESVFVDFDDYSGEGTVDRTLYAFDKSDGTERWAVSRNAVNLRIVDNTLFGWVPATLKTFDTDDGSDLWSHELPGDSGGYPPVIVNGLVYYIRGSSLYALSGENGRRRISQQSGENTATPSSNSGLTIFERFVDDDVFPATVAAIGLTGGVALGAYRRLRGQSGNNPEHGKDR